MKTNRTLVAVGLALALTAGCREEDSSQTLTTGEAKEAVEEAALSSEATTVTGGTIEIATNFTIGGAVEQAADQLRSFITSQLPCASVTLSGATLTIEYGVNPGNCTFNGLTYSGSHTITVAKNAEDDIVVDHTWDKLSNGRVSVSGTAEVTWSIAAETRHIVHELTWTRLSDGRTGTGTGDRTQKPLEGGLSVGFEVDGSRTWQGESGRWDLAIQGVQMRWVDPVPQAGTFVLATPKNKTVTLSFSRIDADTIEVTVSGGGKSFHFDVTETGGVSG